MPPAPSTRVGQSSMGEDAWTTAASQAQQGAAPTPLGLALPRGKEGAKD